MITKVKITALHFYPGCQFELAEKTAIITLDIEGDMALWPTRASDWQRCWQVLQPDLHEAFGSTVPDALLHRSHGPVTQSLGEWIVAVTIALLRWARDPVWQGRVVSVGGKRLQLAIPYERQPLLKEALEQAIMHVMQWQVSEVEAATVQKRDNALREWLVRVQRAGLAPSAMRFAMAARLRNIPVRHEAASLVLGWGAGRLRMDSSFSGETSTIATRIARNKHQASQVLRAAGVPVPASFVADSWKAALAIANKLQWPVVVKPANQDQGIGVVPGILDEEGLRKAYDAANRISRGAVIIEKHVEGLDHRMLVVKGRLLMTTQRIPGGVVGDGVANVRQLLDRLNADPRRGTDKRSMLITIPLDEEALYCLTQAGLTPESVPEAGRVVTLRRTANISNGGTALDVTARVHPDNRVIAERAARCVGLDIAGVDFLCPDISRSWLEVGGAVCEVNAQPGLRVHWMGDPARDINGEILDRLLVGREPRIPVAAITGTNGKTTTARMLHHIWKHAGKCAGVCTTHGVWVGNDLVSSGNLSGNPGGRMLLADPAVEAAIIEMPRKGLITLGHPCDEYAVAALLNVQQDHIGVDGIVSPEAMARLKASVLQRARKAAIINADDRLCLDTANTLSGPEIILFTLQEPSAMFLGHLHTGGRGVMIDLHQGRRSVVLAQGAQRTPLMALDDIPATGGGLFRFNEFNAVAAIALAWAQELPLSLIRAAMQEFAATPQHNPGRYNVVDGLPFQVMVDFAHNPDGLTELCDIVRRWPVPGKRRLLSSVIGNRERRHLDVVAAPLAATFDHFIICPEERRIRESPDYRDASDPVSAMLTAVRERLLAQGVSPQVIEFVLEKDAAMARAIAVSQPGDLLVMVVPPWVALPYLDGVLAASNGKAVTSQGTPAFLPQA